MQRINFKTMLRKWHTYMGLVLVLPMLVLVGTGIILLNNDDAPKSSQLQSAALCDDGALLLATSHQLTLNNTVLPVIFPLHHVVDVSCRNDTIDVLLRYGPLFSTNRYRTRWQSIPIPFEGASKSLSRVGNHIMIASPTALWHQNEQHTWRRIQVFQLSWSQRVHAWHAGWVNGASIEWLWSLSAWGWLILIGSGVWVFVRMLWGKTNNRKSS